MVRMHLGRDVWFVFVRRVRRQALRGAAGAAGFQVTHKAHRRELLQALADQARGRMHAAGEATRSAAHSYAAGHVAAGDGFVADARAAAAGAGELLDRLERLGKG